MTTFYEALISRNVQPLTPPYPVDFFVPRHLNPTQPTLSGNTKVIERTISVSVFTATDCFQASEHKVHKLVLTKLLLQLNTSTHRVLLKEQFVSPRQEVDLWVAKVGVAVGVLVSVSIPKQAHPGEKGKTCM